MRLSIYIVFISLTACGQVEEQQSIESHEPVTVKEVVKVAPEPDLFKYQFPWLDSFSVENTIINRIEAPYGYEREKTEVNSFTHWLRRLPLKEGNPEVKLYNGDLKWNQTAHAFVLDLDVGKRDLQQCADAAMRIRAEYLYSNGKKDSIHFNYTNGAFVPYSKWRSGYYPTPKSGKVIWSSSSKNNGSYPSFKKYLVQVYNYAGTLSLSRELKSVPLNTMQPGDLFLFGGSPGHAVMVMDVVEQKESGEIMFLLAQSYMPAQEIHILKNPNNSGISPWYSLSEIGEVLETPEWTFDKDALVRWE